MAKKKLASNKVKNETEPILITALRWTTTLYMIIVLLWLPIYTPNAYYGIGDNKWKFWIWATTIYVAIESILTLIYFVMGLKGSKDGMKIEDKSFRAIAVTILHDFSILDWFVAGYIIVCLISSATSPFIDQIWAGAEGWNMGLWSQLGFGLGYFFISRTWKYSNSMFRWALVIAGFIFLCGILMRFNIDPLGFYDGLSEDEKFNYISTLGQTSWYSSYLCLLMPLSIIGYYHSESLISRIFYTIITVLGFCSTVTQNSDSAYLAFVAYMFVMMWISFRDRLRMQRFLEVILICLASFKFIGILQLAMPDRATKLDSISTMMSQSTLTWLALVAVAVVYVLYRYGAGSYAKKHDSELPVQKAGFIRWILLAFLVIGLAGGITYIVLNTIGALPEGLASENNYLMFSEYWGNYRGISWTTGTQTYLMNGIWYKLVGTGPDTFGAAINYYFEEYIMNFFYEATGMYYIVNCAHNEWLNALVTDGLIGLVAYLGMYVVGYARCMKHGKANPELFGIAMAIAAYIAHNSFCYQQVICTSVIIALLGAEEALLRNGHVESDSWDWNPSGQKITFAEIFKQFMGA